MVAGHKQEHYKEFNSLMQQYSAEASELTDNSNIVCVALVYKRFCRANIHGDIIYCSLTNTLCIH